MAVHYNFFSIASKTNLTEPYLTYLLSSSLTLPGATLLDSNRVKMCIFFRWCQMCDSKSYQNLIKNKFRDRLSTLAPSCQLLENNFIHWKTTTCPSRPSFSDLNLYLLMVLTMDKFNCKRHLYIIAWLSDVVVDVLKASFCWTTKLKVTYGVK